jgi:hypothetical protein
VYGTFFRKLEIRLSPVTTTPKEAPPFRLKTLEKNFKTLENFSETLENF